MFFEIKFVNRDSICICLSCSVKQKMGQKKKRKATFYFILEGHIRKRERRI